MTKQVLAGAFALANPVASPIARPALIVPKHYATPRAIVGRIRADVNDPKKMIEALTKAFEDFKAANDERIASKADAVVDAKVKKIDDSVAALQTAIDEMNRRIAASALGGLGGDPRATPERRAYSEAFNAFFRKGVGADSLKDLALKAQLTRLSDPDGGYVVSPEIESMIDRVLGTVSVMRMLATVRPTGASVYKKRVGLGGASSGWVGEQEARTETDTPRLSLLEFPAMTLYAEPEATEEMLEDADFDIAAWLSDEVDIEFAEEEGAAHWTGSGVKKPRGVLDYDTVEDDTWSWGKIGFRVSGHATLINSVDPFINLTETLKQGFRPNASWVANRSTWSTIRQLKDSEGRYHWQPSVEAGKPATFLGYPTYADDNMPNVGAGAFPVAFGDFRRGYLIVDRRGIRVLRNPFKNHGFVNFYTTKRTGGGVQHFQAIKLMKVSA